MSRRREIQQQHERAVVSDFLEFLKARRKVAYRVIAEPNPPEAVIRSKRLTRWVEVVDAFWSEEWAHDQYSYATPDEEHTSIGPGPHLGPDEKFTGSFIRALSSKLAKASYVATANQYGPGYLVVNVDYPLYSRRTHAKMTEAWRQGRPWPDRGCFREVFLRIRMFHSYRFQTWPV